MSYIANRAIAADIAAREAMIARLDQIQAKADQRGWVSGEAVLDWIEDQENSRDRSFPELDR
ncbi:MAG: hypothetical protein AAGF30_06985 [Pseudomonadota bacterium]